MFGNNSLFAIIGDAFTYQASAVALSYAQRGVSFTSPALVAQDPISMKKLFFVKPVSKAQKTRKTGPKASKKRQTSNPKFITNEFCEKLFFEILSRREPRFRSPKHRNFYSEKDEKSDLETSPEIN